jgi:hypothetical protein
MNEEKLKIQIYKRLGLDFGSLTSESGNDWIRAEKEVLEEFRQKEFEELKNLKTMDYLTIEKNSDEFQAVINSPFKEIQNFKILIAQRSDLEKEDINKLINDGNKDILISLVKYQKLLPEQIDLIIPRSVYLVKKHLIEKQNLSNPQKKKLEVLIEKSTIDYSELLLKIYEK